MALKRANINVESLLDSSSLSLGKFMLLRFIMGNVVMNDEEVLVIGPILTSIEVEATNSEVYSCHNDFDTFIFFIIS